MKGFIGATDSDWFACLFCWPGVDEEKYIEAIETEDPDQKEKGITEIVTYIREDLEATWADLNWLKSKAG